MWVINYAIYNEDCIELFLGKQWGRSYLTTHHQLPSQKAKDYWIRIIKWSVVYLSSILDFGKQYRELILKTFKN
jgi:hypothetical protein